MGKLFNYDNLFFRVTGRIGDLFILNLMWIIGCLPVITMGASTLALYTVIERVQNGEEGYLCRDFWKAYKKHLKRGIGLEFCLLAAGALISLSVRFWGQLGSIGSVAMSGSQTAVGVAVSNVTAISDIAKVCYIVSLVVLLAYILVVIYIFQVMLHTDKTIFGSIAASFVAAAQNLPKTLLILLMMASVGVLCYFVSIVVALFLCIGVAGMCYMILFLGPWHKNIREKQFCE